MALVGLLILILVLAVVPFFAGRILLNGIDKDYVKSTVMWYIVGWSVLLGVFQLITVPMTLLEIPFHILVILYSIILFAIVLYGSIRYGKESLEILGVNAKKKEWKNVLFLIAVVLVMMQAIIPVWMANFAGADDAGYIAYSNDIVYNDALYAYSPYTGEYTGIGVNKMTLTSWCAFIAYLTKVSGIHVATVAHTIMPFVVVASAYCVYYLIAKLVFRDDYRKIGLFITFLSVLHIWGGFTWYNLTLRLLQCQWHGKAVMATIFIPLVLLYTYEIFRDNTKKREYLILILISLGATGTTLIGAGLACVVMIVETLILAVSKRKIGTWLKGILCCIPCGVYCMAFLLQYALTAMLRG